MSKRRPRRWLAPRTALLLWLAGCTPPGKTVDNLPPPPPIDYAELRRAYNERTDAIRQFWAHAVVEFKWTDDSGRTRIEQGEGPLIFRQPHDLALSVGKLGHVLFWLGADAQQYWLFELQPPQGQPKTLHVGRHADLRDGANPLPLPVRPDRLPDLLGVTPLPERSPAPAVLREPGRYVIPSVEADGMRRQLAIDPGTARPRSISWLDRTGRTVLRAKLSGYEPLPTRGKPPGAWPQIPSRIEIHAPRNRTTVTLVLSALTDQKVKDAQFDLQKLRAAYQPEKINRF